MTRHFFDGRQGDKQADHMEDSAREKLMGLKFIVHESPETIQKLDKTIILENTRPNLQQCNLAVTVVYEYSNVERG